MEIGLSSYRKHLLRFSKLGRWEHKLVCGYVKPCVVLRCMIHVTTGGLEAC